MTTVHRGHIFHIAGAPLVSDAPEHLAHFPDGALVVDNKGVIAWCGHWAELPAEYTSATQVDHHAPAPPSAPPSSIVEELPASWTIRCG